MEGNALQMEWTDVIPKHELDYIIGNPPFVSARMMGAGQKDDVNAIFPGWKNAGNLDYVSRWYKKAVGGKLQDKQKVKFMKEIAALSLGCRQMDFKIKLEILSGNAYPLFWRMRVLEI